MNFKRLPLELETILILFNEIDIPLSAELINFDLRKKLKNDYTLEIAEHLVQLFNLGYIKHSDLSLNHDKSNVYLDDKFVITLKGKQYLISLNEYNLKNNNSKKSIIIAIFTALITLASFLFSLFNKK